MRIGLMQKFPAKSSTIPKLLTIHEMTGAHVFAAVPAGHCKDAINIVWDSDACRNRGANDPVCKQFIDDMTSFVGGRRDSEAQKF